MKNQFLNGLFSKKLFLLLLHTHITYFRLFFLAFLMFLSSCHKFAFYHHSDKEIRRHFQKAEKKLNPKNTPKNLTIPYQIHHYPFENWCVRYLEAGNDSLPVLLMLHGSPSSLVAFRKFYTDTSILKHFKIVAVDRLGYGDSNFGRKETSVQKQMEAVLPLIQKLKSQQKKILLFGSSYGGTLASRLAMETPQSFEAVFFLSSALGSGLETVLWISRPVPWFIFGWMFPRGFTLANAEKRNHKAELLKYEHLWGNINIPCAIMHGEEDNLVHYENVHFAQKMLTNVASIRVFSIPDIGHGLYWTRVDIVKKGILEFWEEIKK